jgi:hypothetical protein
MIFLRRDYGFAMRAIMPHPPNAPQTGRAAGV